MFPPATIPPAITMDPPTCGLDPATANPINEMKLPMIIPMLRYEYTTEPASNQDGWEKYMANQPAPTTGNITDAMLHMTVPALNLLAASSIAIASD